MDKAERRRLIAEQAELATDLTRVVPEQKPIDVRFPEDEPAVPVFSRDQVETGDLPHELPGAVERMQRGQRYATGWAEGLNAPKHWQPTIPAKTGYSVMPRKTRVVPLDRWKYKEREDAAARFEELRTKHGWTVCGDMFWTRRYFCWRIEVK
jgi:hypothetical protein